MTPWTITCQAPLFREFFRQEYWSRLALFSPGDLADPGIEPGSCTLQADSLLSKPPGKQSKCPSTDNGLRRCDTRAETQKYYSAIKKNEILPFAAMWMKLQNIILIEIRQILYGITYVEYKKIIQMDVHTKEK